jgi:hypothetical protein
MLRRFLWGLIPCFGFLLVVEVATSFLAPCSIYQEAVQHFAGGKEYDDCALQWGVISAGLDWISGFSPETWTALATFVIAGFTATLWLATSQQARLTRRAIERADEASRRELRAYPGITDAGIELLGAHIKAHVNIRNFSPTPAYNFRGKLTHKICDSNDPGPFDIPSVEPTGWDMPRGAFSTVRLGANHEFPLSAADRSDILGGKKRVVIMGRAEFIDAFDQSRFIEFRYRNGTDWNPPLGHPRTGVYTISGELVPEYFRSN